MAMAMKRDLMKHGLLAAGLVALVGLMAWALWPKPVAVEVARLQKGPLAVTVDEEGKTRVKAVYVVSAPITGKLLRLALEAGDPVRKNLTTVAVIEPTAPPFLDARVTRELTALVEAAKAGVSLADAEVKQAEAELAFAESELARAQSLMRSKTIAPRVLEKAALDVDARKAAVAKAKATLNVRQRELDSVQARLIGPEEAGKGEVPVGCCINVLAPVNGRLLRILQESERVVSAGTPLVEIGDPGNLEVVVELLSTDAVKIREGALARVEGWGGTPLEAKVTRVEPAGFTKVSALGIEEQRVRTILELAVKGDEAKLLGHDFRVFVKINAYTAPHVLRVPISALFRRQDRWAVYILDNGRARAMPIDIGQRNSQYAEVHGGIGEQALVVLHPSDRVVDGVRLEPIAGSR